MKETDQNERINDLEERFINTIELALNYGQIDGSDHKMWCIDQMLRILLKDEYATVITKYKHLNDDDIYNEEEVYEWNEGVAP